MTVGGLSDKRHKTLSTGLVSQDLNLGVKLGSCNETEMYREHMKFDSSRFHSVVIWQVEINPLFDSENL